MTCTKIGMRAENLSPQAKRYRYEYSRKYKEQHRRANGTSVRAQTLKNPRFRGQELSDWLQRFITIVSTDSGNSEIRLNGIPITDSDLHYIRRLPGTRATLQRADELATKYHLPLWEMVEAAGAYKKDKRAHGNTGSKRKLKADD